MFRNLFKKRLADENDKVDAGHVKDAASWSPANLDRARRRPEHLAQARPSPGKYERADQRADRILSLDAVDWLQALPHDVRPVNLAQRHPRICNRIAERWKYPELMVPYFDDLLMDGRGGRQGFPMSIAIEISSLREHYQATVSAATDDVWNRVVASRMF